MAFTLQNFTQNTVSTNTAGIASFNYDGNTGGTTDTLATITTAGYFNALAPTSSSDYYPNLTAGTFRLKIHDIIFCNGSDSSGLFIVTAVSPNVILGDALDGSGSGVVFPVTTTATLTNANAGQLVYATGSSSYVVTLPAVATMLNQQITIMCNLSAGNILTLNVTGGSNINGVTTIRLSAYQTVTLFCDGTQYINASGTSARSFAIYNLSLQTFGGGAATQTITVPGVISGDLVLGTVNTATTVGAYISRATVSGANTIVVTFNADPGANTAYSLIVARAP